MGRKPGTVRLRRRLVDGGHCHACDLWQLIVRQRHPNSQITGCPPVGREDVAGLTVTEPSESHADPIQGNREEGGVADERRPIEGEGVCPSVAGGSESVGANRYTGFLERGLYGVRGFRSRSGPGPMSWLGNESRHDWVPVRPSSSTTPARHGSCGTGGGRCARRRVRRWSWCSSTPLRR
jgi:hypothetical protein